MEIKRMPRSQFLKLSMENNKKKNTESECSTKKLIIKKEYKCNHKSPVCFVLKI